MPGVGKSTVGVLVAKRMGLEFLDIDAYLQARRQSSLAELLTRLGRDGFCSLEERTVAALTATRTLIATGGSVVYGERAMQNMASAGWIVHLDVELAELEHRVGNLDARAVVRAGGQTLGALHQEREPLYRRWADVRVELDGLTPQAAAERVVEAVGHLATVPPS